MFGGVLAGPRTGDRKSSCSAVRGAVAVSGRGDGEKEGEREREKKRSPLLEGFTGSSDAFVPGTSTGGRLDDGRCKIDVFQEAGLLLGNDRDDDRLRLIKYAANHPEGVPLPKVVRDVFGKTGPVDPGDRDYQLARRFYTTNSRFFQVNEINGMTAVESLIPLLDLIAQGIVQKSDGASTDREFARSLLSSVSSLNDRGKGLLAAEIEKYVNRVNDWRLLFRATDARSGNTSTFMKPYKTRFNDVGRIKQQWARYNQALDYAREEFDNAALVTLTSDPSKFPHLLAMADEITPNFNRLMSWMGYDCKEKETSRPGYRPNFLRTLEFTEDGKAHLHLLFFGLPERADGIPWLIDKGELSEKWDDLGQGRIVDIQALTYCDDLDERYDWDEGFINLAEAERLGVGDPLPMGDGGVQSGVGGGQTAGQYLGKYLSSTFGAVLDLATSESFEADGAYAEKSSSWKIAMYWATGKRMWTCSKEIEQAIEPEDDEPEDLPIVIEFVGAYPFWDLPASVVSYSQPFAVYVDVVHGYDDPDPQADTGGDRPPPTSA